MILRNPDNGNCIRIENNSLIKEVEYYGSFITKEQIENVLSVFPKSSNIFTLSNRNTYSKSEFAEDKVELLTDDCEICTTFRNIFLNCKEELDDGNTKYEICFDWKY